MTILERETVIVKNAPDNSGPVVAMVLGLLLIAVVAFFMFVSNQSPSIIERDTTVQSQTPAPTPVVNIANPPPLQVPVNTVAPPAVQPEAPTASAPASTTTADQ